jgi:hypothetical protein
MKIESNWRILFDPFQLRRTLLDFSDMLDSELAWSLKKSLQVTQLDEARAPFLRHAGNAVVNLNFKVYQARQINDNVRAECLDGLIDVASFRKAPLQIQVRGRIPNRWLFQHAYITEIVEMQDPDETGIIRSFSIAATDLSFYLS